MNFLQNKKALLFLAIIFLLLSFINIFHLFDFKNISGKTSAYNYGYEFAIIIKALFFFYVGYKFYNQSKKTNIQFFTD